MIEAHLGQLAAGLVSTAEDKVDHSLPLVHLQGRHLFVGHCEVTRIQFEQDQPVGIRADLRGDHGILLWHYHHRNGAVRYLVAPIEYEGRQAGIVLFAFNFGDHIIQHNQQICVHARHDSWW